MNRSTTNIGFEFDARVYADRIKYEVNNKALKLIELNARGKNITKAIDIMEILKRELKIDKYKIISSTEVMMSREKKEVKVSVIKITLIQK